MSDTFKVDIEWTVRATVETGGNNITNIEEAKKGVAEEPPANGLLEFLTRNEATPVAGSVKVL